MRTAAGFSLVHVMIYLILFALVTFLIFSVVSQIYTRSVNYNKQLQHQLTLHSALDLLVKDLQDAAMNKQWWSLIPGKEVMFHRLNTKEDVQWIIKEKRLLRFAGMYSRKKKKWGKRTKSLVAADIHSLHVTLHEYENSPSIKCVTGYLSSSTLKDTLQFTVALHNKRV